jgi:hypothetical protein
MFENGKQKDTTRLKRIINLVVRDRSRVNEAVDDHYGLVNWKSFTSQEIVKIVKLRLKHFCRVRLGENQKTSVSS